MIRVCVRYWILLLLDKHYGNRSPLDVRSIGCEAHLRRHASTTTAAVATSATPTAATAHGFAPSGPFGGGSGCVSCPDLHEKHLICGTRGTVARQTLACVPLPLAQRASCPALGYGTAAARCACTCKRWLTEASRDRNLTRGLGGVGGSRSSIQ